MELVNKVFKAVVDGAEKNVAPATRSDNVYLASDQEKTIEEGLISVYIYSKSGTTHALAGTGNNIKFVADADYNDGDTITVNGQAVTAQTQDGEPLSGGAWAAGAVVVCWINGTVLTMGGGGGGTYTPPAYSTTEWISTGETWIDGKPIYQKVITANHSNGDVISELSDAENIIWVGGHFQYSEAPYVSVFPSAEANPARCCTFKRQSDGQFTYEISWNGSPSSIVNVNIVVKATLTT